MQTAAGLGVRAQPRGALSTLTTQPRGPPVPWHRGIRACGCAWRCCSGPGCFASCAYCLGFKPLRAGHLGIRAENPQRDFSIEPTLSLPSSTENRTSAILFSGISNDGSASALLPAIGGSNPTDPAKDQCSCLNSGSDVRPLIQPVCRVKEFPPRAAPVFWGSGRTLSQCVGAQGVGRQRLLRSTPLLSHPERPSTPAVSTPTANATACLGCMPSAGEATDRRIRWQQHHAQFECKN